MTDLFQRAADRDQRGQPLAERMRPRKLSEVIGQQQILAGGAWLPRALATNTLTSIILWGPPGVGKTTIGRLLADEIGAYFVPMSAVMSGVKDIREAVTLARDQRNHHARRTLLFIDEIHRWSKAQQDALLPHVEAGTIVLVGATTENPSFEVNAPLLSRTKVLVLQPLGVADIETIVQAALTDRERGLGALRIELAPDVLALIAREARGDARRALYTLESAAAVPVPGPGGTRVVDATAVEEGLQRKALLYDKAGDEHYGVVSAFIKSMRGSDPDAAVYWLARMLEAGEDMMFVARRIVIFASEDIGNADPRALQVAVAARDAVHMLGMPEAIYAFTQAVTYMAVAPKSNSAMTTYAAARLAVQDHGALPVPKHLLNATTGLQKQLGHGRNYQYPHDHAGHHVAEQYLPDDLAGQTFYAPSDQGTEKQFQERLSHLRGRRK